MSYKINLKSRSMKKLEFLERSVFSGEVFSFFSKQLLVDVPASVSDGGLFHLPRPVMTSRSRRVGREKRR